MSKIITVSGKAGAGKDSLALLLKKKLEDKGNNVIIFHYADALKFICRQYFDWDGEKDLYGRTLLQTVGTDIARTSNPDYWVIIAHMIIDVLLEDNDYIIIPDCRFPNEIETWEDNLVAWIKVSRPGFDNSKLNSEQKHHASETSLDDYDFSHEIEANNLEELEEAAEWFVNDLLENLNKK